MMANDPELRVVELGFAETMEFNADSVEWCPFPQLARFLVCGTYHLNEAKAEDESQTRNGNISLYKLKSDIRDSNVMLDKTFFVDTSGILDMKWCPELINSSAVLGVAGSDGTVLLLKLFVDEYPCLESFMNYNISEEAKKMVLSLDWSTQHDNSLSMIASDNAGDLHYLVLRESELCLVENWNAHQFGTWIAAFDYSQPQIIYSGGDDCCFKSWDLRSGSSPVFTIRKHTMGVTAISKSKRNENLLVTGSYEENVFLWDVRSMKTTVSEICLGGGIWRLKWHPTDPTLLLSASMHNGFHVLSTTDGKLNIEAHYDKHASLAYGVDWCYLSGQQNMCENKDAELKSRNCTNQNLVASCSFYDKLLHVWRINL